MKMRLSTYLGPIAGLIVALGSQHAPGQDASTERFTAVEAYSRPDLTLATVAGETRSVSDWNGQVVLVDFWASWCVPCRKEMPVFNELRAKYADQGFEVVGVAADDLDKVVRFLGEVRVDFPIVYGDVPGVMEVSAQYGNSYGGLPFSAFIDRDGNVRYTQKPGLVTLEQAEEILKRLL